jgi:hypothetical protein
MTAPTLQEVIEALALANQLILKLSGAPYLRGERLLPLIKAHGIAPSSREQKLHRRIQMLEGALKTNTTYTIGFNAGVQHELKYSQIRQEKDRTLAEKKLAEYKHAVRKQLKSLRITPPEGMVLVPIVRTLTDEEWIKETNAMLDEKEGAKQKHAAAQVKP